MISKIFEDLKNFKLNTIIPVVANKTMKFFLDTYSHQGYFKDGQFIKWEPRKNDKRIDDPILYKSGKLKSNFNVTYEDNTFRISNDTGYASYINFGTSKMVARPFLYDDIKVREIIKEEATKEMKRNIEDIIRKNLKGGL